LYGHERLQHGSGALRRRLGYYGGWNTRRQPAGRRNAIGFRLWFGQNGGGFMLSDMQIFATFRWLLAIICTIYTLIVTGQTLRGWLVYFAGGRQNQILGRYTLALLLRVRLRRFAWELAQIAGLAAILFAMIYAHKWLE
jgi:hypothetical protein